MGSQSFSYTGARESFTVPSEVDQVTIKCWGAGGAPGQLGGGSGEAGAGGTGGYGEATVSVTPGETLYVRVGGAASGSSGGWNGGGDGGLELDADGGGGGGASDVRRSGDTVSDILALGAGGGGGGATSQDFDDAGAGGDGGGLTGQDGEDASSAAGGAGGTQTSGAGQIGGGNGAGSGNNEQAAGGGGGAGWYGGFGGGQDLDSSTGGAGGGGGSSFGDTTTTSGGNTGDGDVTIEWDDPPAAPSNLSATGSTETSVDLSWTDNSSVEDGFRIYRSTSSGVTTSDTLAGEVGANTTTFTDTGLDAGTQYHYIVVAYNGVEVSSASNEIAETTPITAPTNLSIDAHSGDQFDLSWTDNSAAESGYRVYVSTDGGASWTLDTTVAADATTATTSNLLDGEAYDIEVRAYGSDAEAASTVVTGTTTLPDAQQPTLGNGVEDEVAVSNLGTIDNGSYRIQIRETGESSWDSNAVGFAEQTVAFDGLPTTFGGREDGEEYEVRARTETEHVTGAWTSPVAIVTKFPGASNVTPTATGRTSVDLTWTDNADNEDGFRVQRREQRDDGTTTAWQTLADRAANTTANTDDTLLPGTTYDYRVEAYTDDATAFSPVASVTTDAPRFASAPKRSTGWYIEIDHPSGETLRPEIVGDPTANPRLRDKPTLTVEVSGEGWRTDALERQPARAWQDGIRAPVDTLTDVSETPRGYELVLEGGDALDVYIERYVDSMETYALAEDLIANNTGLVANVDDPASETTPDVLQRDVSTESEWTSVLLNAITASDIYEVTSTGELQTRQTAYFLEAEDMSYQNGSEVFTQQEDRWSGFTAIEFDGAGLATRLFEDVTTDHTIPASNVRVAFRTERDVADHPGFAVQINGETITQIPADFFQNNTGPTWFNVTGYSTDLPAGEHTVELDFNEAPSGDGAILVDCVLLFDDRVDPAYSNNFPEAGSVECNEYPSGSDVKIETDDVDTVRQIVAGRLDVSINNTGDAQALEISNDRGANWISASNASSVEGSFASGSTTLRARFSLGGYDADPTASPAGRTAPQQISSFQLYADVNDTPLTQDTLLEGRLGDILADLGRDADAIWEYQIAQDGTRSLEWTQPGLRTASADESLTDWEVREDYSVVKQAIVRGESRTVRDESITLQHGVLLGLEEDYIRPTTERVAATDGTVYERGTDYEMDYIEGAIEALASGNIADNEDVLVDYEHQIRGSYTSADYSGPSEKQKFNFPNASSQNACEQLALTLVKDLGEPRVTATVEIDSGPRSWSLVDAVSFDGVPLASGAEVYDVSDQPGGAVLELGSRPPVEEAVEDLRTQVSNLNETV